MTKDDQPTLPSPRFRPVCWSTAVFVMLFLACACVNPFNIMGIYPRSSAYRAECRHRLQQIGLALHNYHDDYGAFPPAFLADSGGRAMHSWRVLLLPYLDRKDVYSQYRFDEPWNSEHNLGLVDQMPRDYYGHPVNLFSCPSGRHDRGPTSDTSYVAIVGDRTVWLSAAGLPIEAIHDGGDQTIMVVEVANSGIHWMEPRDLAFDAISFDIRDPLKHEPPDGKPRLSSTHIYDPPELYLGKTYLGVHVLFGDGTVRRLPAGVPPDVLRAMLTINAGEDVNVNAFP
jgi:hypothetical protein